MLAWLLARLGWFQASAPEPVSVAVVPSGEGSVGIGGAATGAVIAAGSNNRNYFILGANTLTPDQIAAF